MIGESSIEIAKNLAVAYLSDAEPKYAVRTNSRDWHPINHPHNKSPAKTCKKCGSASIALPAYNADWFDCLDCGHSWPQTEKQAQFMRTHPASMYSEGNVRETVVTNDRTLNYVLQNAGNIIGRRDISPMDKFETLFSYLLKARREVLGAVDN